MRYRVTLSNCGLYGSAVACCGYFDAGCDGNWTAGSLDLHLGSGNPAAFALDGRRSGVNASWIVILAPHMPGHGDYATRASAATTNSWEPTSQVPCRQPSLPPRAGLFHFKCPFVPDQVLAN